MPVEFVRALENLVQVAMVSHSAVRNLIFAGYVILLSPNAMFAPSFQRVCKVPFWMPAVHVCLLPTLVAWPVLAATKFHDYMDAKSLMLVECVEVTTVPVSIALVFPTARPNWTNVASAMAKIYAMIAAASHLVSNSWMYAECATVQITPLYALVAMAPLFHLPVIQPFLMPNCGVALLN